MEIKSRNSLQKRPYFSFVTKPHKAKKCSAKLICSFPLLSIEWWWRFKNRIYSFKVDSEPLY